MSNDTNGAYATAGSVAGLAREVEQLRRDLQPLHGINGRVDELAAVVARLSDELAALAAGHTAVVAPSWLVAPVADDAKTRALLEQLSAWLSEVLLRYPDAADALPDCWLWHPDVVEELVWLMYAWHAAYQGPHASVALAGDWHDRYRPGVIRRIKEQVRNCSLDAHPPRDGHDTSGAPVVPLADEPLQAFEVIADWWAHHRTDPPPVPTEQQRDAAHAYQQRRWHR